jgi:hypothetical protein
MADKYKNSNECPLRGKMEGLMTEGTRKCPLGLLPGENGAQQSNSHRNYCQNGGSRNELNEAKEALKTMTPHLVEPGIINKLPSGERFWHYCPNILLALKDNKIAFDDKNGTAGGNGSDFNINVYEKIHLPITIAAAALVVAVCLILGETLFTTALLASISIIMFYVLGNLVRYYIITRVFPPPPKEDALDDDLYDEMNAENPDEMMTAGMGKPASGSTNSASDRE